MTWHYQISDDGSQMDIWDHTGQLIKTLQNDGSGLTLPNDVTAVMRSEAEAARANNNMDRWRDIHIRLADDDIAEGAP